MIARRPLQVQTMVCRLLRRAGSDARCSPQTGCASAGSDRCVSPRWAARGSDFGAAKPMAKTLVCYLHASSMLGGQKKQPLVVSYGFIRRIDAQTTHIG